MLMAGGQELHEVQRIEVLVQHGDGNPHHDRHFLNLLKRFSRLFGPPCFRLGNVRVENTSLVFGNWKFFEPLLERPNCQRVWHVFFQPSVGSGWNGE